MQVIYNHNVQYMFNMNTYRQEASILWPRSSYNLLLKLCLLLVIVAPSNWWHCKIIHNKPSTTQGNYMHQTSPAMPYQLSHFEYTPYWCHLHLADCRKTWCHPQNWKYITYFTVTGAGPSHGHGSRAEPWPREQGPSHGHGSRAEPWPREQGQVMAMEEGPSHGHG